jgi:NAD(P)-dependent dehydrogenase (short-subunit alcohol dehydrogenase family)
MSARERVGVVTGGSRGLGLVIARVLAQRGYDLVIGAREEAPLAVAVESLRQTGRRIVTVHGDVTDPSVRSWLIFEAGHLGGLDVLVNNASELGGIRPVGAWELSSLERVLSVNVVAPVALVQLALPLLQRRNGLVVNVSSDAARGAYPGWGAYGASKAALDLITRTLHAELAGRGVAAVSVDPGDMRTRMHQEAFPGEDISDRPLPEITAPFWNWLFDQAPAAVSGERFAAQQEDARWLQQV